MKKEAGSSEQTDLRRHGVTSVAGIAVRTAEQGFSRYGIAAILRFRQRIKSRTLKR